MEADKFNRAADAIMREANRMQGLVEAAETLRDAATVFARLSEAERTLAETMREKQKADDAVREAQSEAAKLKAGADDYVRAAHGKADGIIDAANADIQTATAKAEADAKAMIDSAKASAKATIEQAKVEADAAKATVSQCAVQKADLLSEISAKQDELDAINAKIESARQAVAKFLA